MRGRRRAAAVLAGALALLGIPAGAAHADHVGAGAYQNPLTIVIPGDGTVETFADPAVIKGQDGFYYAYGTSDPLHEGDRAPGGGFNFQKIPMARSSDLVHWTYIGDAFAANPPWLKPESGMWAPDIRFFDGTYYLYYTAVNTTDA